MGCDIHSVLQVKKNGTWSTVAMRPFDDRDYDAFALLANVRNGYGFAGCDLGDGYIPIDQPRGFPEDFPVIEDPQWMGDHSHSWLVLNDIEAHYASHANRNTMKRGVLESDEYERWRVSGEVSPKAYSGGHFGQGIVTVTEKQYIAWKNDPNTCPEATHARKLCVQAQWPESYQENAVYSELLPMMRRTATEKGVGPDDIRLVFGFDS